MGVRLTDEAGARKSEVGLHGFGRGIGGAALDGVENGPVLGGNETGVLRPAQVKTCVVEMRVELTERLGDDTIA